jgi:hypothetical protein
MGESAEVRVRCRLPPFPAAVSMPPPPIPPLLDRTLQLVARRYRVTDLPAAQTGDAAAALAVAIEQAREAIERGDTPASSTRRQFLDALARMIQDGMRTEGGDAAFQAMVLRHRTPHVREYASLSAHADQDRRDVLATVNAIAHPAKLARTEDGASRDLLRQLHAAACSSAWTDLGIAAQQVLAGTTPPADPTRDQSLTRLLEGPALTRLQRTAVLAEDPLVRRYQSLWDRHGPRSGSAAAAHRGNAAQQRGAAVESLAAAALGLLSRRLNEAERAHDRYRVVTSMRVPASIPGSPDRAKSEWDAVLLRRARAADVWDVCLLVEVKASADAATTDFPRLLRGLTLLASADPSTTYSFATHQGDVRLAGAALAALSTDVGALPHEVLYCCDAPADPPRPLSAASRMQLLSNESSLAFAGTMAEHGALDTEALTPVWQALLTSPRWAPVRDQFVLLRSVRELMVHVADLSAAVEAANGHQ